jgi:hypothetical protein
MNALALLLALAPHAQYGAPAGPSAAPVPAASPTAAPMTFDLIGTARIPGTALDLSGLKDDVIPGFPHARLGGFGSAIDYTGTGDRYVAAADRGPIDGGAMFRDRLQFFEITIRPGQTPAVTVQHTGTAMLTSGFRTPAGTPGWFVGAAGAKESAPSAMMPRYDPEGVRLASPSTIIVSDEYGPFIDEFDLAGRHLRRLPVPPRFLCRATSADPADELPPRNAGGRQPNRGFEGLAISPDRSRAVAILQSPLLQDGALDATNDREGLQIRVLELPLDAATSGAPAQPREWVYTLDHPGNGVSEILAVDATRYLVLERDGKPGKAAKRRGLYLADSAAATDVSGLTTLSPPGLPARALPAGVTPATKSLVLNFLDPRFGLAGDAMPEKIEGLCWGPNLPDGRRTLIVTSDNDFIAEQPSWFWVFAVSGLEGPAPR